jgi:hypothetical protein
MTGWPAMQPLSRFDFRRGPITELDDANDRDMLYAAPRDRPHPQVGARSNRSCRGADANRVVIGYLLAIRCLVGELEGREQIPVIDARFYGASHPDRLLSRF